MIKRLKPSEPTDEPPEEPNVGHAPSEDYYFDFDEPGENIYRKRLLSEQKKIPGSPPHYPAHYPKIEIHWPPEDEALLAKNTYLKIRMGTIRDTLARIYERIALSCDIETSDDIPEVLKKKEQEQLNELKKLYKKAGIEENDADGCIEETQIALDKAARKLRHLLKKHSLYFNNSSPLRN